MGPGDKVKIRGFGRVENATVLRIRGDSVRVRMLDGRERTVRASDVDAPTPTPMLPPPPSRNEVVQGAPFVPRGRPVPKPEPPMRSRAFLDWVRDKPCAACLRDGPSDPHHYGSRGMGQKTSDLRCVPLCRACHDSFHDRRTLPGMNVAATRVFLLAKQVDLLVQWIEQGRAS